MKDFKHLELPRKTNKQREVYKYFVGTTDKSSLSYKAGEKMTFKIRAIHMDQPLDIPYIRYSLEAEDGQKEEGYIEKSEDGWFYIEASISKNGFVYINAKACDANKNPIKDIEEYNGSAGADVEKILCASKMPEDYFRFWDSLKRQVEQTEPEVLFSKRIEDDLYPDFEMLDMRIKAPGSEYVSVAVAYPKEAQKSSLRFAMLFQGYGVTPVAPHPLKDYFTVHVCAHCMPNGESAAFYDGLRTNALKGYGFNAEENQKPQTTYFSKMFLRNLQALRFFKDHPLLNGKDYYFVGSSQGGMQAFNMAAHFERATAAILNVPGFSDIHGDEICARHKNSMPKGKGMTYFDIAVSAQLLKCPVYIISGLGDLICNASSQMALFNAIKAPKYIEFYQNKIHSCSIPWDNCTYSLGDFSLADRYKEHTSMYYDWN